MMLNHGLIITVFIFLVVLRLVVWIISNHRFQNLVFIGIYIIAISPNLVVVFSGPIIFDQLVMAFFDSIWIFILFSIYLVALIIMRIIPKGWLIKRETALARKGTGDAAPDVVLKGQEVLQSIKKDVEELEKPSGMP